MFRRSFAANSSLLLRSNNNKILNSSRVFNSPTVNRRLSQTVVATASTEKSVRPVAWWLLGVAGMVGGMVTVGGVTRITRSGLSMVTWKPHGGLPPLTLDEWNAEFSKYKEFPEFSQRSNMTLDEFKSIFWWEYGHRMLGRVVGVAFTLPMLYFIATKRVPRRLYPRMATLFTLGATQGGIGWWMVKSGLNKNQNDLSSRKEIRVSPYRLATHLGFAFTTYSVLLATAFDLFTPSSNITVTRDMMDATVLRKAKSIRKIAHSTAGVLAITILSGAFVAGIDAGKAYNTWPLMGDEFIPSEVMGLTPLYRNFFEDTATVQLDHRLLAYTTLAGVLSMYGLARFQPQVWGQLPLVTRRALNMTLGMVGIQVGLGITTILTCVPTELAVSHQAGSLALLTSVLWSLHNLRFAKSPKLAARLINH